MILIRYIVKFLLSSWLFFALVYSCADEKRLERRLQGKTWNVERAEWERVSVTTSGTTLSSGSQNGAGYFTFNDEGTGSSYLYIDGKAEHSGFSWKNTENNLTLTHSTTLAGTNVSTRTIQVDETGRRKMKWSYTETRTDASGQHTYNVHLELARK